MSLCGNVECVYSCVVSRIAWVFVCIGVCLCAWLSDECMYLKGCIYCVCVCVRDRERERNANTEHMNY